MRIALLAGGDGWHVRDLARAAADLGHTADVLDFRTLRAGVGITIVSAIAAWSARETYRTHLNDLGTPNAQPVDKAEYERLRERALALG